MEQEEADILDKSMNFVDILIFNFLLQYEKIHFYVCLEEVDSEEGQLLTSSKFSISDHGIMDEEMMMQEDGI